MKVFVNNCESGPLTQSQWKEARKGLARHPASGRVMNPGEARRARLLTGMTAGTALLVLSWIMASIFALVGSADGAIGMFFAGIFLWVALTVGFWLSFPIRRASLVERYRGLPEPGILVKADEAGLTIGERAAAWPEISLAATRFRTDADGEYVLERLTFERAFEGVDLDLDLIEEGDAVVGYAFLRLCPEPHGEA